MRSIHTFAGQRRIRAEGASVLVWHLYVIRTVDRLLYAGISTDVRRRFKEHLRQGKRTAKYLLAHRPEALAFSQAIGDRSLALKVEYHFKQLSRSEKERVIRSGRMYFLPDSGRIRLPE